MAIAGDGAVIVTALVSHDANNSIVKIQEIWLRKIFEEKFTEKVYWHRRTVWNF